MALVTKLECDLDRLNLGCLRFSISFSWGLVFFWFSQGVYSPRPTPAVSPASAPSLSAFAGTTLNDDNDYSDENFGNGDDDNNGNEATINNGDDGPRFVRGRGNSTC